ncbi:MAG: proprotein convertase P-domain-containing protein [Ferruginibacter sp.]
MRKIFTLALLALCSFAAKSQSFSWTGNEPIFDNSTINIPINVSGLQAAIDTNFGVAHICLNITHTYDADLSVSLVSPSGMSVDLFHDIGGADNNFLGTCIGMDGTAFTNAQAPYSGIFFPAGNVAGFNNGQNPNGTWTLVIKDVSAPDTGSIHSAYIEFTNNPPRVIASSGSGAPVGTYVCATCQCPGGGAPPCDLLPDMTSSYREINLNHTEQPGYLYISNATPNIGSGPIDIYGIDSCFCGTTHVPCNTICPNGDPVKHVVKQRVYQKVPGNDTLSYYDRFAGKMTFHIAHGHLHVDNWANYTLRTATANPDARTWPIIASGVKQSFCLINLGSCAGTPGECLDNNGNTVLTVPNNNVGWHTGCSKNQGIYPGSYDVYSLNLNDPIPLENACNGNYYIVSITDPDNNFAESDENNNWVAVPITLTQQSVQPIITPSGSTVLCPGGSVTLTATTESNYLWSTGETTQSITVSTPGTYTVSTSCGTSTATSNPVVITSIPAGSSASVSIAITTGSNPTCPGVMQIFTATPVNGGNLPSYQWKVNGVNVGTNSATYTTTSLVNGDVVTCVLTSNISCLAASPASSNAITMVVTTPVDPSATIAITTGTNPSCSGSPVTFTSTVSDGTSPIYQWYVNNVAVSGATSNTFTTSSLSDGDQVRCDVTSTSICPDKATLGTGTTYNDYRSDVGAAYPTYYGSGRQQYLITAAELQALGFSRGYMRSFGFNVGSITGNPSVLMGYTIKIAQTSATVMTTNFLLPAFTTVYGPVNYTPTLNSLNTHLFTTPFLWDGTSNIVIDICFSNQVTGSAAYVNQQTATAFVSSTYYQVDGTAGATACSRTTGNAVLMRPNITFTISDLKTVSSNTITMGVNANNTYTFTGSGNWDVASNWANNTIPPSPLPSCSQIVVDPPLGQECVLNTTQVIAPGGKITVKLGKKLRIPGKLDVQQ